MIFGKYVDLIETLRHFFTKTFGTNFHLRSFAFKHDSFVVVNSLLIKINLLNLINDLIVREEISFCCCCC